MKSAASVVGLFVCVAALLVVTQQRADAVPTAWSQQVTPVADYFNPQPEPQAKKCSFSSDCPYGKCKKGRCGGCSFKSDCKGWGVCKKGWCGGCSFSSECKGFGRCSSGKCTKSPY